MKKDRFKEIVIKNKIGEIFKFQFTKPFNRKKYNNLFKQIKFKEINPESAILLSYIFSGLFLSVIIYFALNIPLAKHHKKLKEEVKTYQLKKNNISEIKSNFKKIEYKAENLKSDRKFLVNLIAGTKSLDTFMAVLSKNSNRNFIKIIKFEPQNIEKYIEKKILENEELNYVGPQLTNNNISIPPPTTKISDIPSNENLKIKQNKDRLLIIPDIEKHEIQISLEGNYTQILGFIRDIELLENIVLIGDFEIIGLEDVSKSNNIRVRYNANVSAFGRIINSLEKKQNI